MCDGSVKSLPFSIDNEVHRRLCNRADELTFEMPSALSRLGIGVPLALPVFSDSVVFEGCTAGASGTQPQDFAWTSH